MFNAARDGMKAIVKALRGKPWTEIQEAIATLNALTVKIKLTGRGRQ